MKRVADLTLEDLKQLMGEVIEEKFRELLGDQDAGFELREEVEQRLAESLDSKERMPLDEVKNRLGLQ